MPRWRTWDGTGLACFPCVVLDGTKLWWECSPAARTLTRAQRVARNGSALQCTGAGRPGETHCCCRLFSQGRLPPHPNQLKLSLFEVARFGVPCYKASPSCEVTVEARSAATHVERCPHASLWSRPPHGLSTMSALDMELSHSKPDLRQRR